MEQLRSFIWVQTAFDGVVMTMELCKTYRISPSDNQCAKLRKVFDYFQYKAPDIDSPLSSHMDDRIDQKLLVEELVSMAKVKCGNVHICDRRSFKMELKELNLVDFSKPYIYCHKRTNEGHLTCILRHCRNALAHGNVFVKFLRNNTQICLQDLDVDRRTGKKTASALIVINKASLERWMKRIKECEVQ